MFVFRDIFAYFCEIFAFLFCENFTFFCKTDKANFREKSENFRIFLERTKCEIMQNLPFSLEILISTLTLFKTERTAYIVNYIYKKIKITCNFSVFEYYHFYWWQRLFTHFFLKKIFYHTANSKSQFLAKKW